MLPTVAATTARPTDWRGLVVILSAIALTLPPNIAFPRQPARQKNLHVIFSYAIIYLNAENLCEK
jgi:hypothetical protein